MIFHQINKDHKFIELLLFQNPRLWTATRTSKHVSFQNNDQMSCREIDTYRTIGLKISGNFINLTYLCKVVWTCGSSQQNPPGLVEGLEKVVIIGSVIHLTSAILPNSTSMWKKPYISSNFINRRVRKKILSEMWSTNKGIMVVFLCFETQQTLTLL